MTHLPDVSRPALRAAFALAVILLAWQLLVTLTKLPAFLLPSPWQVLTKIVSRYPVLMHHAWVTLQEMLLGLLLGLIMGFSLAMQMVWFRGVKRWLLPLLIISQAIPVFAIAPLLMLWLGYGIASKVVMAALIIFFPLTSCCFDGLNATPKHYLELCQTMGATRWQQLIHVRLPAALPAIASGLRISVVIAPIGAISGEWVGASEGLGYLMLQANARMLVDEMFAALAVLACLSMTLYAVTSRLLNQLIYWNKL